MTPAIVLLSGEIASGKSAVARCLIDKHSFRRVGTGSHLLKIASERGLEPERNTLKNLGDTLDIDTKGQWVSTIFFEEIASRPDECLWVLDSIRRDFQIPWFRMKFAGVVLHVHLTAPNEILRSRYENRRENNKEYARGTTYEEAKSGPTELHAAGLSKLCDLLVNTNERDPEAAANIILERLRSEQLKKPTS